ncbi:MAG: EthD family reductase [Acidobacteria bacterium]|nr:EthD family reductase [Acidobacteriota bacterium]
MISGIVMYPNTPGGHFDWTYYLNTHIPLALRRLGSAVKDWTVEQGVAGMEPGSAPAYVAMARFLFDSLEAFQQAFAPHADELLGDIPNYTNIQPTIQFSEVKMSTAEAVRHI